MISKIHVLYGYFEMFQMGVYSFRQVWHHDANIDLSREEQLIHNKKIDKDFAEDKVIVSNVKLIIDT